RVTVKVVDIAGGRAYLMPGEAAGVGIGSVVVLRDRRYRVVGATAKHSVIEMQERELRVGMTGKASASTARSATASLPKPKPLDAYENQWPEPVLPATKQTPEYVPLGSWSAEKRIDLSVSTDVGGTIALSAGESFGRAALRTQLHAEPFEQPVFFDVDLAVRSWFGGNINDRPGNASRPLLAIRELQFGYGTPESPQVGLGRLPFVAVGVGRLDGLRVRSPSWGGFSIGAFGGTVPNPIDYLPTLNVARFGVQLAYQNESLESQPFVGLSVHASMFDGELDERRLNLEFDVFPGNARVSGQVELSLHDGVNPWQAPRLEVSAAGLDASFRVGLFQLTGRFDRRLPERSLWLTAYLPLGYLCNTVPDPATSVGDQIVCDNSRDARYFGGLDASWSFSKFALHAGANVVRSETAAEYNQLAGYLQGRVLRIADIAWMDVSVAAYSGSFVSDYAARLGAGVDIRRIAELSAYYRVSLNQYDADPNRWLQHSAGGILYLALRDDLDLGLRVDGMFGQDVSVLVLSSNLTWRPSW
ncbi:MAG: hypothetical protein OEV36_10490, partial [Myxococcales bacterium]|nr:hypothetical protein [Myxococcales bacterium]